MEKIQDYGYFKTLDSNVKKELSEREFDLELKVCSLPNPVNFPKGQITSNILCTPTCGNTGTGNSFCCTCK